MIRIVRKSHKEFPSGTAQAADRSLMAHTQQTHAVGIDLGTTYSCIAWLNEHGHPVTIPNQEGELSTPSVVFFDSEQPVVGTEALRNAIAQPGQVVQNAKRHIGLVDKTWNIGERDYTPEDVSSLVLRKLISAAQEQIGEITDAVITVPAQFSDAQRHATIAAGHAAGLQRVEIINEPVAAALCQVLGSEGLAFTELAVDQQLLIFDLGGGTLDLAIVKYSANEVRVVASAGDLELGGLNWTQVLIDLAAEKFIEDFGEDPRRDPESHQFLALEAEQAKRSLSVRPRAAVTVQHDGNRRTYQIEQEEFEHLSRKLLKRCNGITRRILSESGLGWAHIDEVLTTGGASRMPMVRNNLKKLSGRTLNSSLSPDQSIAHGAAYYAGMLLSNQEYTRTVFSSQASSRLAKVRQQSVSARALGILVRDVATGERVPHYLIPPNTPLPASRTHVFGTVVDHQTKVHVRIVESGADSEKPHSLLGNCQISDLPADLREGSKVEVTISYDRQARVHVSARELQSNKSAEVEIIRQENMSAQLQQEIEQGPVAAKAVQDAPPQPAEAGSQRPYISISDEWATFSAGLADLVDSGPVPSVEESERPVLLCNECGAILNSHGHCTSCQTGRAKPESTKRRAPKKKKAEQTNTASGQKKKRRKKKKKSSTKPVRTAEDEFWDMVE